MSIPYVIDGETDLDSTTINRWIENINTVPLASITGALAASDTRNGAINVLDEGADPTGVTDSSVAFLAAIDSGRTPIVPAGDFRIEQTIPTGLLRGSGSCRTRIIVPDGFDQPVIDVDSVAGGYVGGFTIEPESGGTTSAYGVRIHGDSADITVDDIGTYKMTTGVVVGNRGTTPDGTCERIQLRQVRAHESPNSYGISVDDCDGVTLWGCAGIGNWLDGLKLRANTRNVEIYGGTYTGNGIAWPTNGSSIGDGIDAFAGGDTFLMVGGRYNGNYGNGVTIKTDSLTLSDPARYGYVRNARLFGVAAIGNLVGSGITFYVIGPTESVDDIPLPAFATINGCISEDNAMSGYYLGGWMVSLADPISRKNGRHGIHVTPKTRHFSIQNPKVAGNSRSDVGLYTGIYIEGKYGVVRGGTVLGIDEDDISINTDPSTLTKWHGRNIYITADADEIEIDKVEEAYSISTPGTRTLMTTGRCVVNETKSSSPYLSGGYGSVGSEYIQKGATDGASVVWRKVRGTPDQATSGWRRISPVRPILAKTGDYTVAEADFGSLLIVTAATGKTVSLPTAVGIAGDGITIKQGGAGSVTIDPAGTETVNGSATVTVTGFAEIVSDGTNWHVVAGAVA